MAFGRTCKTFTKAEINALIGIKKLKGKERESALNGFCTQYNRTLRGALVKMYNIGYSNKPKQVKSVSNPIPKVNELIVPIKEFKVIGGNLHIIY